ncbi:MAG: hypothetical protein M1821_001279 [Bathelium mastoideum]|nr:MAG: hypothetical protein M1821_001279 [Bathelium mastoideum]KAI9689800.1 MAG: hypothetical protein M1822_009682 [Bathelium mastoideum]
MTSQLEAPPAENNALQPPFRGKDVRSMSATNVSKGLSYNSIAPPGSFSSELKSTISRSETPAGLGGYTHYGDGAADDNITSEQRQAEFRSRIDKETKIKVGSENLLEALNAKNAKQTRDQRLRVESELNSSNRKIAQLKSDLEAEIQRAKDQPSSPGSRLSYLFHNAPPRSPSRQLGDRDDGEVEEEAESPSFVLSEIFQALEAEDMPPHFYVERANSLAELFKRHPTLKYDLAWSIFGLRIQAMLLSDSREVVAAGYRLLRYAVTDRKSLQTIRSFHTDYLVIVSLVKESKASIEREQALKFVRAFLDVKDGVKEISRSIVRIIVAMAEHPEDRLRSICILTLAEILIRDPPLLASAGGIGTLTDALGDGSYQASESLSHAFLYLLDVPSRRKLLRSGYELGVPFAAFTSSPLIPTNEERLKEDAKVVAVLLKNWTGLMTLSLNDFLAVKSIVSALCIPTTGMRNILLELFFDVLRIKPPSWSSSFLAGRRLTTYGRVTNLKTEVNAKPPSADIEDENSRMSLLDHFTAVILAVLLHAGLLQALLYAEEDAPDLALKRKTTLLLGEVLKLSNQLLPSNWSANLQVLPELFYSASRFGLDSRFIATGTIYQVDSVNRTLYRSGVGSALQGNKNQMVYETMTGMRQSETAKAQAISQVDEGQFRSLMYDTQVLNTVNFTKWKWDLIQSILDGPMLNAKRQEEAIKVTKFVHRLLSFLRPFKYRFSEAKNTKPNQRYVRAGCSLMRALLQTAEGTRYLAEEKLLRQIAECLAQLDRMSGITSSTPLFSPERLSETLVGGYFTILGVMCSTLQGLQMLARWKIINMFYHIIELPGRDDLIRTMLSNLDFTLDNHPRIILSKAMTSCSKRIRIFATRQLRKYATSEISPASGAADATAGAAKWAIRLLVTQLYDPEIEVCEVAVKILEEACNNKRSLEYVVKCRPALDHLGEIGAPLLLRFLSTSTGYHYLDGLDYITKEMDDWFLGRNDSYVAVVEASLARALADIPERPQQLQDENPEPREYGIVPPHFYRELTRTAEGCKLLEQKGHFDEFATTIADLGMEDEDPETILKVKGCLWAVGNVGSMALGASFLEKSDVVKWIVKIAEESEVMTMRGTAFFVLGLISRSLHGQEILAEYRWDGTVNAVGECLGFCFPLEFKKLFTIKPWTGSSIGSQPMTSRQMTNTPVTDADDTNARIIDLIKDLGNTVLTKRAAADLNAIKARKPRGFQRPALFHKVMSILESQHYRLGACRFVIDLFDRKVMRQIVLEEEDDDSSDESASETLREPVSDKP